MLIHLLKQWFTTPFNDSSKLQVRVWFILSLLVTLIYGIQAIQPVFSHEYVVQDDARQHVFWALRFLDSELFSNDLIADYYQSNAPWGYASLYGLLAKIGIHPIWVSNFFPLVLSLVATVYGFGVVLQTFPVPVAGFISMVLLNQMMWESPILAGATPRSFTYPLFLMFLYYLLRRNWLPYLIAIVLQGLFYPPIALISAGILIVRLLRWKRGLLYPALEKDNLLFCTIGLGTIFLVLLPHALSNSQFGPIITLAEAQKLPEFYPPDGRVYFFQNSLWGFWNNGQRSGIGLLNNFNAPIIYTALFVPVAFFFPSHFPLVKRITSDAVIFIQIIIVSLGLFFLAHAVLFKLYLPSRYSMGLFLVTRLLAGIGVTLILDAILNICGRSKKVTSRIIALFLSLYLGTILGYWLFFLYPKQKKVFIALLILGLGIILLSWGLDWIFNRTKQQNISQGRQLLGLGFTTIVMGILLAYPSLVEEFPKADYFYGEVPELYEFLAKQPKDILIASLTLETDNLPTFAQRPVLVSREYALPYEVGYYNQVRQRTINLLDAQYSPNLDTVKKFIQTYGIDFWLVEKDAFTPEYIKNPTSWAGRLTAAWIRQYQPTAAEIVGRLNSGTVPALTRTIERCSVLETGNYILLNANCILTDEKSE